MEPAMELPGRVRIKHHKKAGGLNVFEGPNLVVAAGRALIAARLGANTSSPVTYMAIGDGTTAVADAQTALQGIELERVAGTLETSENLYKLVATLGAGILFDTQFSEFGLFNAASTGTMLARFVISSTTFAAGDSLEVSWSLPFGS